MWKILVVLFAVSIGALTLKKSPAPLELLNVSYDPTRELYRELGDRFAAEHHAVFKSSHGGSGSQARAVLGGLKADLVTLALESDIDALRERGFIASPSSLPYTSTIVFLVRKGNPLAIKGWDDLLRVSVITPNPKTSGGARWNVLAAWGHVTLNGGTEEQALIFLRKLFQRVPVLDTGARGSTTTFAQKGIGDALIAWENEALLAQREVPGLEIVYPDDTILAEPPVAIVDKNVDARGTRALAEAFVRFLNTDEAQQIIAKNGYRSRFSTLPPIKKLFTLKDVAGDWKRGQQIVNRVTE